MYEFVDDGGFQFNYGDRQQGLHVENAVKQDENNENADNHMNDYEYDDDKG